MVVARDREHASVHELKLSSVVLKRTRMAPSVLCLLLVCLLQLSSNHPVLSTGVHGLNVHNNYIIGRKLFDEAAPAEPAPTDAPAEPAPEPAPVPAPKPPSPKKEPSTTNSVKANAPAAKKTPPPPTPWYLGGSSQMDSTFAGYSYAFPTDMLNFTDADAYCRKNYKGGHLVSIHSQAQQDFLNKKYVQGTAVTFLPVLVPQDYPTKDGVGHRGVWIGLRTRVTSLGNQGWTDGSSYDYDGFLVGKPDNWQNIEACAQIYGDTSPMGWAGFWDDIACEAKMRFICAWPVVDANNSYPVYNGSEYVYHSERATWETAESTCWKLDGGHLASIHSNTQSDWIWNTFIFPKKPTDFSVVLPTAYTTAQSGISHRGIWIGLNLQLGVPYWTDFTPTNYKNWAPTQPDNWNNIEFCTSLYVDAAPKGYAQKWDDLACEAQLPFLCSRPVNQKDEVYPQYKGWEYIMLNKAMTWMDANTTCVSTYDAQMVSFDTLEELSFVYKQYFGVTSNNYPVLLPDAYTDPSNLAAVNQSYVGIGRRGVWIGLILQDGVWQWSDKSSSGFRSWVPGKPDNFNGGETCTQLYIDSKPTGWASNWDDLACTAMCSAICKRKPLKQAVQAPSAGSQNPYADGVLPNLDSTPIVGDALAAALVPNITSSRRRTSALSQSSIIILAVFGGFIGLLIIGAIVWRFVRPSTPEEEDPATTVAAAPIPSQFKGKAKATGVVHAPTGAGRVPPSKIAASKEPRPSKYVKIDVEDLEVPLDQTDTETQQPAEAQQPTPVSPQPQVQLQPVAPPQPQYQLPQQYALPPQYQSTYQPQYASPPQYLPQQTQQTSFAFPPYTAALPEPRHELMRRQ